MGSAGDYAWRPPPHRTRALAIMATVAIMASTAALVWGVIDMTRTAPPVARGSTPTVAPLPPAPAPPADTTDADRALCTAIAPLMTENDKSGNDYAHLGGAGTPARDAATPQFITDTKNWITRIQPILDQHPDTNAFLRRSLQRLIDDENYLVADLAPGELTTYQKQISSDSVAAFGGPLHLCYKLGIKW